MVLFCQICSEDLEQNPSEEDETTKGDGVADGNKSEDLNISALLCGHVFHTRCIQKWICGNLESSKFCPYCRSEIKDLKCITLFLANQNSVLMYKNTSHDNNNPTDLPSASSQSSGGLEDHSGYKLMLQSQKRRIDNLQRDLNDKTLSANLLANDLSDATAKLDEKTKRCGELENQIDRLDIFEDLSINYRMRAERAETQLVKYKRLRTLFDKNMDMEKLAKSIKQIVHDTADGVDTTCNSSSIKIPQSITNTWHTSTALTDGGHTFQEDGSLLLALPPFPTPLLPKETHKDQENSNESHANTRKPEFSPPPKPFLTLRRKENNAALLWSYPLDEINNSDDGDKDKPQPSDALFFELYVLKLDLTAPSNLIARGWEKVGDVEAGTIPRGARISNVFNTHKETHVLTIRGVCKSGQSGPFSDPAVIFPKIED